MVLLALTVLAACANTNNPTAAGATDVRVAGGAANRSAHNVNAVSDALGQRLDGMLSASQH
jgi:hypothetical protein